MTTLKQYFYDITKILYSQYELSSNLHNSGLIGRERELFIENFLKKTFPQKFVIGTGEIIDSNDNRSKQADIVIYDESMPCFDYGNSKHFLSGGVLAHIEVKSNLDSSKLTEALGITKSMKSLNRDIESVMSFGTPPKKIGSFLFAYNGVSKETFKQLVSTYYQNEQDVDNYVDSVCVLNQYVMIKRPIDGKITPIFLETKEDSLMVFFLQLYGSMLKNWQGIPDLTKYLNPSSLKFKQF